MFSFQRETAQRKTARNAFFNVFMVGLAAILAVAVVFSLGSAHAAVVKEKPFRSPEEAVNGSDHRHKGQ